MEGEGSDQVAGEGNDQVEGEENIKINIYDLSQHCRHIISSKDFCNVQHL